MTSQITEKQKQAIDALEAARREHTTLRGYAQAHSLKVQDLYNALAGLRRKGLLEKSARRPRDKFVAVRIEPDAKPASAVGRFTGHGVVCRIVHPSGYLIECTQWPPSMWLTSLSSSSTDAAT